MGWEQSVYFLVIYPKRRTFAQGRPREEVTLFKIKRAERASRVAFDIMRSGRETLPKNLELVIIATPVRTGPVLI